MNAAAVSDTAPRIAEMFSLAGRVALVTGASRGLGRAMAVGLAEAGADVICHASRIDGAADTVAEIQKLGRDAWAMGADLSQRDAVLAMADESSAIAGRVDI